MEDISFYKNVSDDYFYLSPKEGDLEKEMATHSSILAWTIPWTEKPGGLQSMGSTWLQSKELDRTERLTLSLLAFMVVLFLVFKEPSSCFP